MYDVLFTMHTWSYPGTETAGSRRNRSPLRTTTPPDYGSIQIRRSITVNAFIHSRRHDSIGFTQTRKRSLTEHSSTVAIQQTNFVSVEPMLSRLKLFRLTVKVHHRCRTDQPADSTDNRVKAATLPVEDP